MIMYEHPYVGAFVFLTLLDLKQTLENGVPAFYDSMLAY